MVISDFLLNTNSVNIFYTCYTLFFNLTIFAKLSPKRHILSTCMEIIQYFNILEFYILLFFFTKKMAYSTDIFEYAIDFFDKTV